ncbi:putative calcium-dependent protein kinase, partial [Pelagophyceae sp. CCMP2097]
APVANPETLSREVNILKSVQHPNIIRVYDGARHHVFIVTELCSGGELFDSIVQKTTSKEGHYSEHDAARVVQQILQAVAYCHGHGICHRDLKPENFLFQTPGPDAVLKIIDFGLSTAQQPGEGVMHTLVGTPYYIAPEVLQRNYSFPCDLWSVGCVTYILLCGYPPFNGNSDAEIFGRIRAGLTAKSFPKDDWAAVSGACLSFIKNLLSLDAANRFTADEALKDAWITESLDPDASKRPHAPRLSGDALAARFRKFVGLTRLKKAALNVLAHHLTEREISELSKIWAQMDSDNTGEITFAQLRRTLQENGHSTTEDEMTAFVQGLDSNDDHVIDYYEFAAAMLSRNQTIRDDRLKEVFEAIDTDHKGYVSVDDLVVIMGSRAHAEEVLLEINPPDGKIHFDEL